METTTKFKHWLNTFLEEKGIDQEEVLEFNHGGENHFMPIAVIVEFLNESVTEEVKSSVKDTFVKIDFKNGNVRDFLLHLAKGIAGNK